jgi:Bacterial Ig-like domain (group 2)
MQSVVRSTFVLGLFAFAGLTACGDKVTVPPPVSVDSTVHIVTVSPPSVQLKIGDKVTLAASVDAGPGVTDRTVTWSSSNSAVASVDQTGTVTAVSGGNATIIAASKANPAVQGASAVSVAASVAATITIANINQTTCSFLGSCNSVPANLAAIMGQIDVTMNVDPGTQTLAGVDLIMNCSGTGNSGTDTVVASQNIGASDKAPLGSEAAAAPVQLSFNTASFNATTGAVSFRNGNCTIKGRARTSAATQAGSNTENLVLANPDAMIGNMVSTLQAINPNTGLNWHGGNVTISAVPVFFTPGRSAVSTTLGYEGKSGTVNSGGPQSVTFIDTNNPASTNTLNIDGITANNSENTVVAFSVDNSGNNFFNPNGFAIVTAASYLANPGGNTPGAGGVPPFGGTNPFRLDTQKPVSGGLALANNSVQNTGPNSFLNASFVFAGTAAAGYQGADTLHVSPISTGSVTLCAATSIISNCDFNGVDSVTVIFQTSTSASGTFTTVTSPASLAETATNTSNLLRQITTDKLGNADTSWVCTTGACPQFATSAAPASAKFGVDKTPPTQTQTGGEVQGNAYNNPATPGNYIFNITDPGTVGSSGIGTYAGPGTILVAQVRQWNGFTTSSSVAGFENVNETNCNGVIFLCNANRPLLGETLGAYPPGNTVPCTIGRFNASSSKAGPNALPVVAANGTTVGFCTPIPFTPGGVQPNQTIPSSNNFFNGYYTTSIISSDQANNISSVYTATVLGDNTIPIVLNIDVPPTITGNATTALPANVTDNVGQGVGDFVASWPEVTYGALGTFEYAVTTGPGVAFDNVLTNTATITPTVPNFILQLQTNNGVAAPANTTALVNTTNATAFIVAAQDPSANIGFTNVTVASQPTNFVGSGTNFATSNFTGGFSIAPLAANVSNGPASVTPANPTTVVITAAASGTTGIFTNPFVATQLWYRPTGGPIWFLAPATDAVPAGVTTSDNGVTRTWNYAFTWNPPAKTPASHLGGPITLTPATATTIVLDVVIIGINSKGDGVQTPISTITLTNP